MTSVNSTSAMPTYGFLGPVGTFTQAALRQWQHLQLSGSANAGASGGVVDEALAQRWLDASVPFSTVPAALAAVRSGEVDAVMVPIENSVEGGVSATLDALNEADPLRIIGEVLVPITFVLAAPAGTREADITGVGSHSHAWPQVRGWMAQNLPQATYVPTLSTAAAASGLADGSASGYQAAVCAPMAASVYGLSVLATDIGDNSGAVTRFVAVSRDRDAQGHSTTPAPTGHDKTTVALYQHSDRPGGLVELLEQFTSRGINLSRLESRPTGEAMGSYFFSVDFEGHVSEERVGEALMGLRRVAADVRFLGSYARADRRRIDVAPGMDDAAFVDSRAWLASLR